MEKKENKNLSYYIRIFHRDVGFFVIGLTLIYALSGIILTYRDIEFMNVDVQLEEKLKPSLDAGQLSEVLYIRHFEVIKSEGDIIYFKNGKYNKSTGIAEYTTKQVMFPFNKFIDLHKTYSENNNHWFATIYAILLTFLALSSLWMFKSGSKIFKRGIYLTIVGIILSVVILMF